VRSNLAPERLLAAYAEGIFPMGDEAGRIHWLAPQHRAVLDLDRFQISRSLRSSCRRRVFEITLNAVFPEVLSCCADRPEGTWITSEIVEAYTRLHRLGYAHSVETWAEGGLAGGLYGVSLGGAFFGESMFHCKTDASKVALVALVEWMRRRGFVLLDVQFMTDHLRQFGAIELPRDEYERRLHIATAVPCRFVDGPGAVRFNPTEAA
jgi:leucyl/phenylalanyl-tRNA--protein transferase